jgi:hypothetical protein
MTHLKTPLTNVNRPMCYGEHDNRDRACNACIIATDCSLKPAFDDYPKKKNELDEK